MTESADELLDANQGFHAVVIVAVEEILWPGAGERTEEVYFAASSTLR